MNTRRFAIALAAVTVTGCSIDPSGTFHGTTTTQTTVREYMTPVGADGTARIRNASTDGGSQNVRVGVRRIDETHFELDLGFCTLRTEQSPDPNTHNGELEPDQSCPVEVEGNREMVPVQGHVSFEPEEGTTVHLQLNGELRRDIRGVAQGYYVGWSFSFDGRRNES